MNGYILELIKETVNDEKESNTNKLYRMFWINILEQFKKNPINYDIFLWVKGKGNNYYNLIYYNDNKLTEVLFKMTKQEKEELKSMLLEDGFTISDSIIKISRDKIIKFANSENKNENEEKAKIVKTVPETDLSMLDEFNYNKTKKC